MCREINQKMRGWLQYYSIGKLKSFIQRLDQWLRTRIRQYIWKQWKKSQTRVTNLKKLGMSYHDAYKFASTRKGYWRIAHSQVLTYSLTNRKLEHLGLINMSKTLQSIQKWLSCRTAVYGSVRTVVWEVGNWINQLPPTRLDSSLVVIFHVILLLFGKWVEDEKKLLFFLILLFFIPYFTCLS